MRRRYVWSPAANALVEVDTQPPGDSGDHHHFVRGDISDFVSPIDGTRIGSRSDLRQHMRKYGVVPQAELCPRDMARKAEQRRQMRAGTHPSQKAARIETIRHVLQAVRNRVGERKCS